MTLILPQERINLIIDQCQLFLLRDQLTVWKIVQLIGKLSYSAVAALSPFSITGPQKVKNSKIFYAEKLR